MAFLMTSPKFSAWTSAGLPGAGYKLYTYTAGTTTPKVTYTDTGGGTPNANPTILDARGEASIYLATDAFYKFVLKTDADVTVWTVDNVGASDVSTAFAQEHDSATGAHKFPGTRAAGDTFYDTGTAIARLARPTDTRPRVLQGGAAPSWVLPTPTGVVMDFVGATAPTGWLLWTNSSGHLQIGDASSGANLRANADAEDLFILLWNSMANAQAPVSSGRGATAAEDFAAHKYITLPDIRGRATIGTGTGSGLTARTHGAVVGEENHTLSAAELAAHSHVYRKPVDSGQTTSAYQYGSNAGFIETGGTENNTPAGSAHNNVQPSLSLHKIIKL